MGSNKWQPASAAPKSAPDSRSRVQTLVEQVEKMNLPEISQDCSALLAIVVEQREARHVIGPVFMDMPWDGSQMVKKGQEPREDFYLRRIRYLAKHARKVIEHQ